MLKKTLLLNGALCAYWEFGDIHGFPVVFVHGYRGDHHGLEGIATALAARALNKYPLRIIIPDLPGFGQSEPLLEKHTLDAYGSWLQEFTIAVTQNIVDKAGERAGATRSAMAQKFALVAHSFGTLVTANALAQGLQPTAITMINPIAAPALTGPRGILSKIALWYHQLSGAVPTPIAKFLLSNPLMVRIMSVTMAKTTDKELRRWIHTQHALYFSSYASPKMLLEAFTASVQHTVTEYQHKMTMKTAIIAGDMDDITPLTAQQQFVAKLPQAKLYIAHGVGHLVHYEAVEYAAEVIDALLQDELVK